MRHLIPVAAMFGMLYWAAGGMGLAFGAVACAGMAGLLWAKGAFDKS